MNSKSELQYKGYIGSIEVSIDDNCLHGRIQFINDLVSYEGNTPGEIKAAFETAVDEYLEFCKANGKEPDKSYSGTFNIRIGQSRHTELAKRAFVNKVSLNDELCSVIDEVLFRTNKNLLDIDIEGTASVTGNSKISDSSGSKTHASNVIDFQTYKTA